MRVFAFVKILSMSDDDDDAIVSNVVENESVTLERTLLSNPHLSEHAHINIR